MDAETMQRAQQMARTAGTQDIVPRQTQSAESSMQNPAERPGRSLKERLRVPMSVPVAKLAVPDIPGFHLHWFRGTPDRIARAEQAGYEFVTPDEVTLNNLDLGGESAVSGNTDMGSRVSVASGEPEGPGQQPVRMILMKLREEWWQKDQADLADRNEQVAEALRGGRVGMGHGSETPHDQAQRYVKQGSDLFTRKIKR